MVELVTKNGWKFNDSSSVNIRGTTYDMETLTEKQRSFVAGKLNEQALNAAYAGKATVTVHGLPTYEEAFG